MTSFEEILSAICTEVAPINANDTQKSYSLSDVKEARLAYDVLVAHGFEAKVYPESDSAKLYITLPAPDAPQLEQRLDAALAYARSLKPIKQSLDNLIHANQQTLNTPEYTLTLANAIAGGKQIVIQVTPTVGTVYGAPKTTTAAPAETAIPAPKATSGPAQPVAAPMNVSAKSARAPKKIAKQEVDEFSAGPAVARKGIPAYMSKGKQDEPDSYGKQLKLYIKGNVATATSYVGGVLIILLVVVSFIVMLKGFLCPDLAYDTRQNVAWYCPKPIVKDKDKKKDPNAQIQQVQ